MNTNYLRVIIMILLANGFVFSATSYGQNPFDDTKPLVVQPQKVTTSRADSSRTAQKDIQNFVKLAGISNAKAGTKYKSYVVGFALVSGKISFVDETKNSERISWLEKVLGEHGCTVNKIDKKEAVTGSIVSRVKTVAYRAEINGRDFVVESIIGYYGGEVGQKAVSPVVPAALNLSDIVDAEMNSKKIELEQLDSAYRFDKLLREKQKIGFLDVSKKKAFNKALEDLTKNKIPALKAKLEANQNEIASRLKALGDQSQAAKRFKEALEYYQISRIQSDDVLYQTGNCYTQLGNYDAAIAKFSKMSGEKYALSRVSIAICQHEKGNNREAQKLLLEIIQDSYYDGSQIQRDALALIKNWYL